MQTSASAVLTRLFFLWLLIVTTPLQAAQGFVVGEIKIEGLERLPDGTLLNYLPIQVGDPVDQKQISFAIHELYKTGFFANVALYRDDDVLIVRVKERPSISDVSFSGNSDIDDASLEEALEGVGMVKGRIYNRTLLEKLSRELERVYFSRGKYGVRIDTEVTELDQNRVEIDITISEGVVALIKQINIIGNNAFDDETLLDEFNLGVPSPWAILSDADEYSRPKLNADLEILRSYYLDRGYLKFSVTTTQVSITPDKKDIYITINVEEGDQYKVSDVDISGKLVFDKVVFESMIKTREGELFSRKQMTSTQKALKDAMGKVGYHFSQVEILPQIDEQKKTISLTYVLKPGNKVYVRRINFTGNYRTHEIVLRREMRLMEGSVLASDKLERSRIRLQRLSYIEGVKIDTVPVSGVNNLVDLNVNVEERLSGSFNIGAGFSQTQGFLFNVGLTQENLFGTGQRLQLDINTDRANTIYNVSFTDPYYTLDGVSRSINAFYRKRDAAEQDINGFQTNTFGANISYGIPLSEYNTVRLGYGYRNVELLTGINASDTVNSFIANNGSQFGTFTLNASFTHDTRNRTVFATRGSAQTVGVNVTVPGSDLEYYKLTYDTKFYFKMTDDLTLLLRSNLAYGDGYGDTDELPFFERYFAGGLRTVRGYDTNSLGPRDTSTGLPVGGNLRVTAGADIVFPVPFTDKPPSTVRFSAFYDIGNVFLDGVPTFNSVNPGFDSGELRTSVGVSFVWLAPIGPLRFSWARPLNSVPGDDLRNFQFSIGSFF